MNREIPNGPPEVRATSGQLNTLHFQDVQKNRHYCWKLLRQLASVLNKMSDNERGPGLSDLYETLEKFI